MVFRQLAEMVARRIDARRAGSLAQVPAVGMDQGESAVQTEEAVNWQEQ